MSWCHCFLSFRRLAWRNLKYPTTLNSSDLHSSASVKLNRAGIKKNGKRRRRTAALSSIPRNHYCQREMEHELEDEEEEEETWDWQECDTTAGCMRIIMRRGSVHHRNHTWTIYSALIQKMGERMQSDISTPTFFFFISSSSHISTIQTISPVLEGIAFYFSLFFLVPIWSIIIIRSISIIIFFNLLCHRTQKCCATVIWHF